MTGFLIKSTIPAGCTLNRSAASADSEKPWKEKKRDDASISPLSSFEWQSLWGTIHRGGGERGGEVVLSSPHQTLQPEPGGRRREEGGGGEAQWGGRETRREEMEGRRRKSEVKVTPAQKNWNQLEGINTNWSLWRRFFLQRSEVWFEVVSLWTVSWTC